MTKKLSKKQVDYLLWNCFKDGVRTSEQLSMGQREVLESMKIYEEMDTHIDKQLKYFSQNGY